MRVASCRCPARQIDPDTPHHGCTVPDAVPDLRTNSKRASTIEMRLFSNLIRQAGAQDCRSADRSPVSAAR